MKDPLLTGQGSAAHAIAEAFSLPKHCKSATIRIAVGEIATIEVEYHPTESMLNRAALETIKDKFELVKRLPDASAKEITE